MDTITVPINSAGIVTDLDMDNKIADAMKLQPSDIYIYAWGWETAPGDQESNTARFINGLGQAYAEAGNPPANPLNIGLVWPSTIRPNPHDPLNAFELLSYFSDLRMADQVGRQAGYAVMSLIVRTLVADMPCVHWIGHSMGCRIACSAINALDNQAAVCLDNRLDAVLLEAAFNNDELDINGAYRAIGCDVRIMVTTNAEDRAVHEWYPAAERFCNFFSDPTPAMGATGPTPGTMFDREFHAAAIDGSSATSDSITVDLTPMTATDGFKLDLWSGAHDDIYQPELWRFIAGWLRR